MPVGFSDGTSFTDAGEWLAHTSSGVPLESPTEPAGASKSEEGTKTAQTTGAAEVPDYDYASWQKANPGVQMAPGQHYPDTYKLPNHMTFSDESIYHGVNGTSGGHWGTDENGADTFTPGRTNLEHHSMNELRDYFARVEPNAKLLLPDISDVPHHDWIENVFSAIKSGLTLPGDVATGKVDPLSQEGIERAADLAGTAVLGPAPIARSTSGVTLGSFAGAKSLTADTRLLNTAKQMESDAVHPMDIHADTGWFKGADNQWRYEIPDKDAKLGKAIDVNVTPSPEGSTGMNIPGLSKLPGFLGDLGRNGGNEALHTANLNIGKDELVPLPDVLDHPELFKAYPQLEDIYVAHQTDEMNEIGWKGAMDTNNGIMYLAPNQHPEGLKSTILHETQHMIQRMEGFAPGAAGDYSKYAKAKEVYDNAIKAGADPNHPNMIEAARLINQEDKRVFENYQRYMGEVEARNTQSRMNMTEAERAGSYPPTTEDRPRIFQTDPRTLNQPVMASEPERIKSAALRYKDQIFEGENHGIALGNLGEAHPDIDMSRFYSDVDQGFTTSTGRFISREEAADMVGANKSYLLSEDLDKLQPYKFHGTDEERKAAIAASKRAYKEKYKSDSSLRENEFKEDIDSPSWGKRQEIDGLLNKGKLTELETARLRYLLKDRYKKPNIQPMAEPTQFRRAANDNFPEGHPDRPYNVREPGMIGSDEEDKALMDSWNALANRQKRLDELYQERMKLYDILKQREWTDIEKARFKKNEAEHEKLTSPINR